MVSGYRNRRDLSHHDIDEIFRSITDWVVRNAEIRRGGISGWLRSEHKNVDDARIDDMIRRHNDAAHYANSFSQPGYGYFNTEIYPKVCETVHNRGYYPRDFDRRKSLSSIINMCDVTLERILDEYGIFFTRRFSLCNSWLRAFAPIWGTSRESKLATLLDYLGVNLTDHESSRPDRQYPIIRPHSPSPLFNNFPLPLPNYAAPSNYGGWTPYQMPHPYPMPPLPRSPPIPPPRIHHAPPPASILRRNRSQDERLNADLPPRLNYGFDADIEEDTANWIRGIKQAKRRKEVRFEEE